MHTIPAASTRRPHAAAAATALSLFTLTPLAAIAQTASLEPVVVTGSRSEQQLDEALAPVTLITRADIERLQTTDLVELISRQAGVQFARAGGPGTQASVFARGAGSTQLLVLVDGVRLNTVTSGAAVLGGMTVDAIDRIEIVRGNLSSLYGSEAIGGVVQIFTRGSGAPREVVASAEGGSGSTYGGTLSATETFGKTRLSATAAGRHSEPFSAIDVGQVVAAPPFLLGANPDEDGNRQYSGSMRFTQGIGDNTTVGFSAWTQRNRTEFDSTSDGPSATHDEDARSEAWQANARHALTEVWTLNAQIGQATEESEIRSSLPTSFDNGRFEARNRTAQLQAEAFLAERVTALFGFEYLDQRGGSTGYDPNFTNVLTEFGRHVTSVWFGVTGRTLGEGRQSVQLSVRHDDYSDVGDTDTWLAAYGYALTPRLRAIAQASTAFRAPSFNDLYFPGFGNPDLAPEKAKSAEFGLRYANQGARASLSWFKTRTRDLIQFSGTQVENVANAKSEGVELSAGAIFGPWQLDGNVTYLDARDENTNEQLVRRAPWTLNLGVFHDQGRWRLGGEVSWVDERDDFDINTFARKVLPAYTLVRAVAQFKATANLSLKLRLENLLDESYTLVDGYNTWGRAVFGGVEWRL
jgi:vitamin B12 transporter